MHKQNKKLLIAADFEKVFKDKLSDRISSKIRKYEFQYTELQESEYNEWILYIIKTLLNPNIIKAGKHRQEQWETGWSKNLETFIKNKDTHVLIPRYFGKYNVIRWKQRFIKPLKEDFEYNTLAIIVEWLFEKYFRDAQLIYEFGCGTGYHLLRVREINKKAKLYGLDWARASEKILTKIAKTGLVSNLKGYQFDFFNPNYNIVLDVNSVVYTVAALEQTGNKFHKFIDYLLENKPKICVHVEPIGELLDENNLLDYLSIEYFKKRNYLSGFLTYLRKLEKRGKIIIHQAQRTYIGSLFIEGYSVVVWSPQRGKN